MLKKLIALSVVFGLIVADPVAKLTAQSYDDIGYYPTYIDAKSERNSNEAKAFDVVAKSNPVSLFLDLVSGVVGYKASAVTIAVAVIHWLVSNFVVLAIGAIVTLGFCKLTGKCHLVEKYIPVSDIKGIVTPEGLETAEELFINALKRYAQQNKSKN